jgi:hypothetical protein
MIAVAISFVGLFALFYVAGVFWVTFKIVDKTDKCLIAWVFAMFCLVVIPTAVIMQFSQ